ncbi:hypothetical protein QH494_16095 [Sphingomonas sp. AR_OL41]|uniref:hypothetical protein n=1 Tax=Sphingomonas sp. AR_OL41 TaxID=3042729 RepID=UPI002480E763|nr:hypothetical protein [Sphingomonas sp. AR_OL41]MDH7973714.1 hypothetical protein [Sphingomonas sp. AR_OL41]
MKRRDPDRGPALYPHEEAERRAELFLERWRPIVENFEAAFTAVTLPLATIFALWMLCSFVVAIVTGRVAA